MMLSSFVPDKARPLQARPYLIPSIYMTCIAASLLPPGKPRALIGTAAIAYLVAQVPKYTEGEVAADNMLAIQSVLMLLQWVDFFVLHSPDEFERTKDRGRSKDKSFLSKIQRNFDLCISLRGIGWNWKVNNVPVASKNLPKWSFVLSQLIQAFKYYMIYDICRVPSSLTAYGSSSPPSLFSDTIPMQIFFGWLVWIGSYGALNMQYSIFASLTVAMGIYEPKDWPPLMGGLRDLTSVRSAWGKFWHQLLRRKLNLPFRLLTRYMPIKRGTLQSRYLQLYMAFVTSAFIHHIGALNSTSSSPQNNWYQITYFLIQPIAITVEDFATYLGKKLGIKTSWRSKCLGTVCTLAWFSYSLRYFSAFWYNSGLVANSPLPSLIQGISVAVAKLRA